MKAIHTTPFEGLFVIDLFHAGDERGMFVKPLHAPTLQKWGLEYDFPESFYSHNKRGVIRGMHFQYPPDDHAKIVYCSQGALTDVVIDLRKDQPTYGKVFHIELRGDNYTALYVPKGFAHGFCVTEDNTTMVYFTSTVHSPENDGGVLWSSIPFEWPIEADERTHSARDLTFPSFNDFTSPF